MSEKHVLKVKALLLDMDNTLVDSTAIVERTWRSFAQRHGADPQRILRESHGRRTEETVARFAPAGVDLTAETRRIAAQEVSDVDGVIPIPGAPELLAQLPPNRWALVTSAGGELAARRMAAAGLAMPPVAITAEDVSEGKPAPEGYLAAARALDVPAAETVVLEDAEAGILAGRSAGATVVVVGSHRGPATEGLVRVPDLLGVRVDGVASPLFEVSFNAVETP